MTWFLLYLLYPLALMERTSRRGQRISWPAWFATLALWPLAEVRAFWRGFKRGWAKARRRRGPGA